jgi:hypothetical protein
MRYKISSFVLLIFFSWLYIACNDDALTVTCDDLSTGWYNEINPAKITKAQKDAVNRYLSLKGSWTTTMKCSNLPADNVKVIISEVSEQNVELYLNSKGTECSDIGQATFEMTIKESNDQDLINRSFLLTADLLPQKKLDYQPWAMIFIKAANEWTPSLNPNFLNFQLRLQMDYNGDIKASKYVALKTSAASGTSSQIIGDYCIFDIFKPADTAF